jgi:hypothetical protein
MDETTVDSLLVGYMARVQMHLKYLDALKNVRFKHFQ